MTTLVDLRHDLVEEQNSLDALVAELDAAQWHRPTASPGWEVVDQVAHLTYFDERAACAVRDPAQFTRDLDTLLERARTESMDEITLGELRGLATSDLLARWRSARDELDDAAGGLSEESRVDWYGPSMSAKSFLSARLMETWAHGVDVADALGVARVPTDRLAHVARLGLATRAWSYRVRGLPVPAGEVRVELASPAGETWRLGPDDAPDVVRGDAEEFCLVVTQRRHVDDTNLATTDLARDWLLRAQAFAGAASEPPAPRGRS